MEEANKEAKWGKSGECLRKVWRKYWKFLNLGSCGPVFSFSTGAELIRSGFWIKLLKMKECVAF